MGMTKESLFIVVEGMDGSGKTGITRQLRTTLSQTHGNHVALTFEPHDPSAAGIFIRDALTKRIKAEPLSLALAFALNRADHNARVINPFLDYDKASRIMISDRYTLSSLVYQSAGGLTMEDVYNINQWARRPDLTIFLNVSPHNCYARMRNRPQDKELFEKNLSERFAKYQAGIELLRSKGETVVEVDANPTYPEVFASVLETVQAHAPDWLKVQPPLFVEKTEYIRESLSDVTEDVLHEWLKTLTAEDVKNLTYEQLRQLFKIYLIKSGFKWTDKLPWTEAEAYHLHYILPLGIPQSGIALILDKMHQADRVTKSIQDLLDIAIDSDDIQRLADFLIVLDDARFEPNMYFHRDNSHNRRVSLQTTVVTRETLADWVASL